MKMGLAMEHGCLAMSILPLLLLVNLTAACYCVERNHGYATAFCTADVIMEGNFLDGRFEREDPTWVIYEFKVTDVYKGPVNMGQKVSLYSKLLGTTCGYRHAAPFGDGKYVVTGNLHEEDIVISRCSIIQPWDVLAPTKTQGVEQLRNSRCELTDSA